MTLQRDDSPWPGRMARCSSGSRSPQAGFGGDRHGPIHSGHMCWGKAEGTVGASWGSPARLMQGGCSSQEEAPREGQESLVNCMPGIPEPYPLKHLKCLSYFTGALRPRHPSLHLSRVHSLLHLVAESPGRVTPVGPFDWLPSASSKQPCASVSLLPWVPRVWGSSKHPPLAHHLSLQLPTAQEISMENPK